MNSLILKWRRYNANGTKEEIPIVELPYEDLRAAIAINKNRLRPYRKILNLQKALEEEMSKRLSAAREKAIQDIDGLEEENILLVGSDEEIREGLLSKHDEIERLSQNGKIVGIRFV